MRSLSLIVLLSAAPLAAAQQHVAPTDAKSPDDERKSFKLPPGFVAELVASEPDIQKPMQTAFDAKGRLWVTTSHHYPFAVDDAKATDKLFVLSDIAADGKARKVTTFAANLNIPIGVLPLGDGAECIVSSAGRILKLADTDGDGRADKTTVLFSGFGFKDTHGMTNSFTLMPDGWVYACHGFANDSKVKGADGHEVVMHSGHTFRFRPDGSRIEVFTRGQVNPFGMTADPWGNLYTADCHSKPITQLIRGAYYDSFGKPHDGLGYGPHVTKHDHGSTGLCGLTYYTGSAFPDKYRGTMFLGNVVTNRINHDVLDWKGSTPVAVEQPDFLVSGDPWFRPTDIKQGPDGALYVSDFYNKIVGHYEVDLKHPGRDKDRGRVWRIRYIGEPVHADGPPPAADPEREAVAKYREMAAKPRLDSRELYQLWQAMKDFRGVVKQSPATARAMIDVLAVHPIVDSAGWLLAARPHIPPDDTHMRHAARIALRTAVARLSEQQLRGLASTKENAAAIDDAMLGVQAPIAGWWLSERMRVERLSPDLYARAVTHVGRYGTDEHRATAEVAITKDEDVKRRLDRLAALRQGIQAAGATFPLARPPVAWVREWLQSADEELVRRCLDVADLSDPETAQLVTANATAATRSEATRAAALDKLPRDKAVPLCGEMVRDDKTPAGLREKAFALFATSPKLLDQIALGEMLKTAPFRRAVAIANGLAGSKSGADVLLAEVRAGRASARLLQEKSVVDRLRATEVPNLGTQLQELTAHIPTEDARITAVLKQRLDGFRAAKPDAARGKAIYATHCAACHQLAGQGGKVGPNLDGVGTRGADRLCEDVLDPNRNVDAAFRTTQLNLADGKVLAGLLLREEGAVLVLSDPLGKEVRVPAADVEKRRTLNASPMPADWADKLPAEEFYHLLAYLLSLRQ